MSLDADIVEDYRQHTARWNSPDPEFRVARSVPAEVVKAIDRFEAARECRAAWNESYIATRWDYALDRCQAWGVLTEEYWQDLKALLPMEPGWYPHNGRLYGYVTQKTGFELVRKAGAWSCQNTAKAGAYQAGWARRREDEARTRAFCERSRRAD